MRDDAHSFALCVWTSSAGHTSSSSNGVPIAPKHFTKAQKISQALHTEGIVVHHQLLTTERHL